MEDTDYIDLLLEYKRIQEQLETIKREEQKTANSGDTTTKGDTVTKNDSHKLTAVKNEKGSTLYSWYSS